jgi:hypothetical protein
MPLKKTAFAKLELVKVVRQLAGIGEEQRIRPFVMT